MGKAKLSWEQEVEEHRAKVLSERTRVYESGFCKSPGEALGTALFEGARQEAEAKRGPKDSRRRDPCVKSEEKAISITVEPKQVSATPEDSRAAKPPLRLGEVKAGVPGAEKPTEIPTEVPAETTPVEPTEEYDLKASLEKVGPLYPILKDAWGDIIDGFHRQRVDPNWPSIKLDHITDPVQLSMARLIANVCRREVPAEEKTELLRQIASLTGWTPRRIADALPMSYSWVLLYLPDEFKVKEKAEAGRLGGIASGASRLEAKKEPKKFEIPGVEWGTEFVTCSNCHTNTREPLSWRGKSVCRVCYEKLSRAREPDREFEINSYIVSVVGAEIEDIKAKLMEKFDLTRDEAGDSLQKFKVENPDIWMECYDKEDKPRVRFEPTPPVAPGETKEKLARHWLDIAEFTCKVCSDSFLIQHDEATGEHRLWPVRVE